MRKTLKCAMKKRHAKRGALKKKVHYPSLFRHELHGFHRKRIR
ncbi:hypothetical protein BACSTE_01247 [Bacteroides stercoris ATCC 43183]|uniref:Uncharacterized protein n=1 Tax=Bacteroides stercoris ATCC 43183 TaxID=449673 RepID=B0NP51_BACSE|nr:hypothetical protein BACSTE_01247 [Bacteroides stercoris ATCC 43183]